MMSEFSLPVLLFPFSPSSPFPSSAGEPRSRSSKRPHPWSSPKTPKKHCPSHAFSFATSQSLPRPDAAAPATVLSVRLYRLGSLFVAQPPTDTKRHHQTSSRAASTSTAAPTAATRGPKPPQAPCPDLKSGPMAMEIPASARRSSIPAPAAWATMLTRDQRTMAM